MGSDEAFENVTFVGIVNYKGYDVHVFNDDYGQSYFFQFEDKKGQKHEASCGTYNTNYEQEIHDYIDCTVFDGTLEENMRKRFNHGRKINCAHIKQVYGNIFAKMLVMKKAGAKEIELTEDQIISLIQKEVKEIKEEMAFYKEGDARWRELDREIYEISQWLPRDYTEEEVIDIIKKVISSQASPIKGKIIGMVAKEVGSRFDKSKLPMLVEQQLKGE